MGCGNNRSEDELAQRRGLRVPTGFLQGHNSELSEFVEPCETFFQSRNIKGRLRESGGALVLTQYRTLTRTRTRLIFKTSGQNSNWFDTF